VRRGGPAPCARPLLRACGLRACGLLACGLLACGLLACGLLACSAAPLPPAGSPERAREEMVRTQVEARGVTDALTLRALRRVPRHELVPPEHRAHAYADSPLPIGHGQTISQPFIVAFMTQALGLRGGETVLEVGTGSGYQAAVLAEIAARVHTVEILAPLAERARADLARLGYRNVEVRAGDGYRGWPEAAPFDAILVAAAAPRIPEALTAQLKDGGRLVIPVGDAEQTLVLLTRRGGRLLEERVLPVRFVPMTGEVREEEAPPP
jgi:protein-L-isoaspartate(D-aspartate) O-methyltransferase